MTLAVLTALIRRFVKTICSWFVYLVWRYEVHAPSTEVLALFLAATSLAAVMAVVKPEEFTNEPLPIALRALLRGRSQRLFAAKVPISQAYLNRLLGGLHSQYDLSLLENLADAASVPPWHFPEWRSQYIGGLITEVLMTNPNMGITALRALRNTRQEVVRVDPEARLAIPALVSPHERGSNGRRRHA